MEKNRKINFLTLQLLFTLLNQIVYPQVHQEWVQRFNSQGNLPDEGYSVDCDISGNVYVSGYTSVSSSNWDYLTVKYDAAGALLWARTYNGTGNGIDYSIAMAVDDSGNVFVTGSSSSTGTGSDITTIKYNTFGALQWIKNYSGLANGDDSPYAIAVDDSGSVYAVGWSYRNNSSFDYVTIKYNNSGVQQWISFYNGTGNGADYGYAIVVDENGNVIVTGESKGTTSNMDIATVKYNINGIQQWVQRYNGVGNGHDFGHAVTADNYGNIFVTGESRGNGSGSDITTIKYTPNGNREWIRTFNGTADSSDAGYFVKVSKYSGIIITGFSTNNGTGRDLTTIKYNQNGVQQWVKVYNGPVSGDDESAWLTTDTSENIYIAGYTTGNGTGADFATIKYDSDGVQKWLQTYNGTGNSGDNAWSIACSRNGNLYVTGASTGIGTGKDCLTIKYSQPIGIKTISEAVPQYFNLYQNYPNPFNPVTKIKFTIPRVSGVTQLFIYDALGREIATLVNEKLNPGTYSVDWDGTNYPSGVYFYKLETDNYSETKKMVLIK